MVGVPTENLVSPESVRRLCWDWQNSAVEDPVGVDTVLQTLGVRTWQRDLVVPVLAQALATVPRDTSDLVDPLGH